MRKDLVVQEGRMVWQSGESTEEKDQPVLCSLLQNIDSKCTSHNKD